MANWGDDYPEDMDTAFSSPEAEFGFAFPEPEFEENQFSRIDPPSPKLDYSNDLILPSCSYGLSAPQMPQQEYLEQKEHIGIKDVVKEHALPFLPAKSLCRFRAVSKEWNQWIKNPFLAHKQSIHFKDMSGLLVQFPGQDPFFISLNRDAYGIPNPSLCFLPEPVNIRTTCNGLLVCQGISGCDEYYICNPVTKEWRILPKPKLYHGPDTAIALVFEPSTLNFAPHFELVCAVPLCDIPVLYFEIFSSRSMSWRECETMCPDMDALALNGDGFYNGCFVYWETLSGSVLAFDVSNESYGILRLPSGSGPMGTLTVMHGELCYLLPQEEDGAYRIEVYADMDMHLKSIIHLNPQVLERYIQDGSFRVLPCVDDDTLIIILGNNLIAYQARAEKVQELGFAGDHGFPKYLPYVNSLVGVVHPMIKGLSISAA